MWPEISNSQSSKLWEELPHFGDLASNNGLHFLRERIGVTILQKRDRGSILLELLVFSAFIYNNQGLKDPW